MRYRPYLPSMALDERMSRFNRHSPTSHPGAPVTGNATSYLNEIIAKDRKKAGDELPLERRRRVPSSAIHGSRSSLRAWTAVMEEKADLESAKLPLQPLVFAPRDA
jgi:hypothetical protein